MSADVRTSADGVEDAPTRAAALAASVGLSILFLVASTYAFILWSKGKQRKTLTWASLLSALGVLCRYENWPAAILLGILVISTVLSVAFAAYGNVLPCIIAHGTFDAIQMFVLIPLAVRAG